MKIPFLFQSPLTKLDKGTSYKKNIKTKLLVKGNTKINIISVKLKKNLERNLLSSP